jgi:antitoxin VapB
MNVVAARLFKNGQSQAIRIPRVFQFEGIDEVFIRREGDAVIITPKRKNWTSFATLARADSDFMEERPALFDAERVIF